MPLINLLKRQRNMAYHNLCTTLTLPPGTRDLLGLNLKFTIKTPVPNPDISMTMKRMHWEVRLAYRHKDYDDDDDEKEGESYNPKIYLHSAWDPPQVVEGNVEFWMMKFSNQLESIAEEIKSTVTKKGNLPPHLMKALRDIQEDKRFIVLLTDKNLGPAIMERAE